MAWFWFLITSVLRLLKRRFPLRKHLETLSNILYKGGIFYHWLHKRDRVVQRWNTSLLAREPENTVAAYSIELNASRILIWGERLEDSWRVFVLQSTLRNRRSWNLIAVKVGSRSRATTTGRDALAKTEGRQVTLLFSGTIYVLSFLCQVYPSLEENLFSPNLSGKYYHRSAQRYAF